ncbi:MAG: ATP-binding cassette domain-containing protein [Chitinophagaceae bacterium]
MKHILEADSIQLEFEGRSILSDIYINCYTGKISGLLGRNGAGKSCLMQIIYGSLKCEKSVRFDNVAQYEAFKRPDLLLYLPQFNFIPKSLSLKRIFQDFQLNFSFFEKRFPEFSSKYKTSLRYLSNGERRLIELYVILKARSRFVMLDEPFTLFNPIQIEKVKELLVEEKENTGLLITDHLFKHIVDISDNLFVLNNGKTYLTKSVEDIETLGYARFNPR